jgi:hypothetical protein
MANGTLLDSDIVYSLESDTVVWHKDYANVPHKEAEEYLPLFLGKDRVYLSHRMPCGYYELTAFDFRSGALLYESPIWASVQDDDPCHIYDHAALDLITIGRAELIIQLDVENLVPLTELDVNHFRIIRGVDGWIQTVPCPNFRATRVATDAGRTRLALAEEVHFPSPQHCTDLVRVQHYTQAPNGAFARSSVDAFSVPSHSEIVSSVAINPFTPLAFAVCLGSAGPKALPLSTVHDTSFAQRHDAVIRHVWPDMPIDQHYRTVDELPFTLPPARQLRGKRRTRFTVQRDKYMLRLLDGGRLLCEDTSQTVRYLFLFAPWAPKEPVEGTF